MKKNEVVEIFYCDGCNKKQNWGIDSCLNCGVDHCYECKKIQGITYSHGVNISGSGDGYYCAKCNESLTKSGADAKHSAYLMISSLRHELKEWSNSFDIRRKKAEEVLNSIQRAANP